MADGCGGEGPRVPRSVPVALGTVARSQGPRKVVGSGGVVPSLHLSPPPSANSTCHRMDHKDSVLSRSQLTAKAGLRKVGVDLLQRGRGIVPAHQRAEQSNVPLQVQRHRTHAHLVRVRRRVRRKAGLRVRLSWRCTGGAAPPKHHHQAHYEHTRTWDTKV